MKIGRIIAVFLCLGFMLPACANPPAKETATAAVNDYETPTPNDDDSGDAILFKVGNEPITYSEFNFHYTEAVSAFLDSGSYAESGLNPDKPLGEQMFLDSGMSWEDMFFQSVQEDLHFAVAMSLEAQAEGYRLNDEDYQQIQDYLNNVDSYCETNNADVDDMLQSKYGSGMTREHLKATLERYATGMSFESYKRDTMTFSDEILEAYYDNYKDDAGIPDLNSVTVRHILITNKQSALDVLQKFEEGDQSEESFIRLAEIYTEDTESIDSGGLYSDLVPQSEVGDFDSFEAWCFDPERQPGDFTLIELEVGNDIIFFVSQDDPLWKVWSRLCLVDEYIQNIKDEYPLD